MKKHWGFAAAGVLAVAGLAGTAQASGGSSLRQVDIRDRCDEASFNAAIGPGSCEYAPGSNPRGRITFEEFGTQLNKVDNGDDHWRFDQADRTVNQGEALTLAVHNEGGEFHTFTRVGGDTGIATDTGGCVPPIFLGLERAPADPAVCTAQLTPAPSGSGVLSGTTREVTVPTGTKGTVMYLCLIHPWMHTTITVR